MDTSNVFSAYPLFFVLFFFNPYSQNVSYPVDRKSLFFENPENGYAVVKLDSDDGGLITVVGTIPAPAAGERLIVTGKWTAHATYGRQLETEFLERLLPDSTAEIRAYLSSRAVRGVGPKTAEKIVAAFGTDSLKILETAPERLTEIDGISRK